MAVAGVLENHRPDIRWRLVGGGGRLHHLRNLVSRNRSGNSRPRYPNNAGTGGSEAGWVIVQPANATNARNRIAMPPSQRAMNSGFGARIFGRSSITAQTCAITATPPPTKTASKDYCPLPSALLRSVSSFTRSYMLM